MGNGINGLKTLARRAAGSKLAGSASTALVPRRPTTPIKRAVVRRTATHRMQGGVTRKSASLTGTRAPRQPAVNVSTSPVIVPKLSVDRGPIFQSYEQYLGKYFAAKGSSLQRSNDELVNKGVPAFLGRLAKSGVALDTAHLADVMAMMSYLHLPNRVGFELNLPGGNTGLFPLRGRTRFELLGQHNQGLGFKDLAVLPWATMPATAYHLWNIRNGGQNHHALVFRGTNSYGPKRDVKLGALVATGANANGAKDGVGAHAIPSLMRPKSLLAKSIDNLEFIVGHSLGGALSQHLVEFMLARGLPAPFAYFASSPSLSRPCSRAWEQNSDRFFFTGSAQDPVMRGGSYGYPGRELIAPMFDLPVQPGFTNSIADGLFFQHGAPVSLLKSLRGDTLEFTRREANPQVHGEFDPESIPLDMLLYEGADALRSSVTSRAFTPAPVEQIMAQAHALGMDRLFHRDSASVQSGERGPDYAYFIHLADAVMNSDWVKARYETDPRATLGAIASHRRAILENPEQGLTALKQSLTGIAPTRSVADDTMKGGRAVLALLTEVRKDLRPEQCG